MTKRIIPALLLVCAMLVCAPAAMGDTLNGRQYEAFLQSYEENIAFINQNTGRHLLPLVLTRGESNEDGGHRAYELYGDVLRVTVRLDQTNQVIELCQIVLTAPVGLSYGTAEYNDFATSGYHSYALLMAMHTAPEPAARYKLVTAVNEGMEASDGLYQTQVGLYSLTATRVQNAATIVFEHPKAQEELAPAPTDDPEDGAEPAPENEDDGVYGEDEGYIG